MKSSLDKIAEIAGLGRPVGGGWEILSSNSGRILYKEFSDYDGGSVWTPTEGGGLWIYRVTVDLWTLAGHGYANSAQEAMNAVEDIYRNYKGA